MKSKQDEYPKVKYRIVNGYGYTMANTMEEVETRVKEAKEKYQRGCDVIPRYAIKITEEYVPLEEEKED